MKIRNIIYTVVGLLAMTFAACDTVDKDDRYIYVPPVDVTPPDSTGEGDTPVRVLRNVLIEDYTGQLCVNCPNAVGVIEQIDEAYPGRVVTVGIHGGSLSLSSSLSPLGLANETSNEYYVSMGSPAQPSGRINRTGGVEMIDKWIARVNGVIADEASVKLTLSSAYDVATGKVSVKVEALGLSAVSGKLQVWLTEDGIVAPQRLPDGSTDVAYTHNHVFRAAVNGTWGENFTIVQGEEQTVKCETVLDANWKVENMTVVAFVYNDNGVQQVVKTALTGAGNEDDAETPAE